MNARTTLRALAVALGLGALSAAPPAAAIEHEFSGSFQAQYVVTNFNNTPVTRDYTYAPDGLPADPGTARFFEQRVRLGYTARLDERLKFVSKFEIDYAYYGDASYEIGADRGAAVGSDQVNLETKHLYLDFTCPLTGVNARIGMQEYVDAFEGTLLWADAAGIALSRPFGAATFALGFFRLSDTGEVPGHEKADLLALDGSWQAGEAARFGASYYLLADDLGAEAITVHTLGVNARGTLGTATLNGFFLGQFGDAAGGKDIRAFAGNAGAEVPAGPGSARVELCYASGDADPEDGTVESLQTFFNEYWYGSHNLALLTRDDYGLTADNGVVYDLAFGGRGSLLASAGYDLPLDAKTTVSGNIGAGWAAEDQGRKGAALGTEANVRLTRQVYEGLTVTLRAAYLFLGSFYDGVAEGGATPDNPWDTRVIVAFSF